MASVNKVIIVGNLGRDPNSFAPYSRLRDTYVRFMEATTGRDHAPTLSITDDMPEAGGGESTGADGVPEVAGDDDDGGDGDGDPDRRSSHSKPSSRGKHRNVAATADAPQSPHSLLWALPAVTNSVAICRSQLYLLIQRGEFPEPIKLGRSSRWLASEVRAWVHQKAATRVNTLKAG